MQARFGTRDASEQLGQRMIQRTLSEEQRRFLIELPFVIVATLDARGFPAARLIAGEAGFVASRHPSELAIRQPLTAGEETLDALSAGAPLGLLGIDFETRRRLRLNGTVLAREAHELLVGIDQSYGNCKRYIVQRVSRPIAIALGGADPVAQPRCEGPKLGAEALEIVRRADTFFIASAGPAADGRASRASLDVSHRGGPSGFVRESSDARGSVLVFPDFSGNNFFNTLGNLELEPKSGLLFIDFETHAALSVSGYAEVVAGDERLLRFRVESAVLRPEDVPFTWRRTPSASSPATS